MGDGFQSVYKRHTPFSMVQYSHPVTDKITVEPRGDLVSYIYLTKTLDGVMVPWDWEDIIEFEWWIGDRMIDRQDVNFIRYIYPMFMTRTFSKFNYDPARPLFLPLAFSFCQDLPFPIISLKYDTFEIRLKKGSTFDTGTYGYQCYLNYIHLDESERMYFALNKQVIPIHTTHKITNPSDIQLYKPIKFIATPTVKIPDGFTYSVRVNNQFTRQNEPYSGSELMFHTEYSKQTEYGSDSFPPGRLTSNTTFLTTPYGRGVYGVSGSSTHATNYPWNVSDVSNSTYWQTTVATTKDTQFVTSASSNTANAWRSTTSTGWKSGASYGTLRTYIVTASSNVTNAWVKPWTSNATFGVDASLNFQIEATSNSLNAWRAFDGNVSTSWVSANNIYTSGITGIFFINASSNSATTNVVGAFTGKDTWASNATYGVYTTAGQYTSNQYNAFSITSFYKSANLYAKTTNTFTINLSSSTGNVILAFNGRASPWVSNINVSTYGFSTIVGTYSSNASTNDSESWKAFDGDSQTRWNSDNVYAKSFVGLYNVSASSNTTNAYLSSDSSISTAWRPISTYGLVIPAGQYSATAVSNLNGFVYTTMNSTPTAWSSNIFYGNVLPAGQYIANASSNNLNAWRAFALNNTWTGTNIFGQIRFEQGQYTESFSNGLSTSTRIFGQSGRWNSNVEYGNSLPSGTYTVSNSFANASGIYMNTGVWGGRPTSNTEFSWSANANEFFTTADLGAHIITSSNNSANAWQAFADGGLLDFGVTGYREVKFYNPTLINSGVIFDSTYFRTTGDVSVTTIDPAKYSLVPFGDYVVSSSDLSPNVWKMFDGDDSTFWTPDTDSQYYDMGGNFTPRPYIDVTFPASMADIEYSFGNTAYTFDITSNNIISFNISDALQGTNTRRVTINSLDKPQHTTAELGYNFSGSTNIVSPAAIDRTFSFKTTNAFTLYEFGEYTVSAGSNATDAWRPFSRQIKFVTLQNVNLDLTIDPVYDRTDGATNKIYTISGGAISNWGITATGYKYIRIGSTNNIMKITFTGSHTFYGFFVDDFDNQIGFPYPAQNIIRISLCQNILYESDFTDTSPYIEVTLPNSRQLTPDEQSEILRLNSSIVSPFTPDYPNRLNLSRSVQTIPFISESFSNLTSGLYGFFHDMPINTQLTCKGTPNPSLFLYDSVDDVVSSTISGFGFKTAITNSPPTVLNSIVVNDYSSYNGTSPAPTTGYSIDMDFGYYVKINRIRFRASFLGEQFYYNGLIPNIVFSQAPGVDVINVNAFHFSDNDWIHLPYTSHDIFTSSDFNVNGSGYRQLTQTTPDIKIRRIRFVFNTTITAADRIHLYASVGYFDGSTIHFLRLTKSGSFPITSSTNTVSTTVTGISSTPKFSSSGLNEYLGLDSGASYTVTLPYNKPFDNYKLTTDTVGSLFDVYDETGAKMNQSGLPTTLTSGSFRVFPDVSSNVYKFVFSNVMNQDKVFSIQPSSGQIPLQLFNTTDRYSYGLNDRNQPDYGKYRTTQIARLTTPLNFPFAPDTFTSSTKIITGPDDVLTNTYGGGLARQTVYFELDSPERLLPFFYFTLNPSITDVRITTRDSANGSWSAEPRTPTGVTLLQIHPGSQQSETGSYNTEFNGIRIYLMSIPNGNPYYEGSVTFYDRAKVAITNLQIFTKPKITRLLPRLGNIPLVPETFVTNTKRVDSDFSTSFIVADTTYPPRPGLGPRSGQAPSDEFNTGTLDGITYTSTASSIGTGFAYQAYNYFNNGFTTAARTYNSSTGLHIGTGSTNSIPGEYTTLEMSIALIFTKFELVVNNDYRKPKTIYLFGSIDGSNWIQLHIETDLTYTWDGSVDRSVLNFTNTTAYRFYRLLVNSIYIFTDDRVNDAFTILEVIYYGSRSKKAFYIGDTNQQDYIQVSSERTINTLTLSPSSIKHTAVKNDSGSTWTFNFGETLNNRQISFIIDDVSTLKSGTSVTEIGGKYTGNISTIVDGATSNGAWVEYTFPKPISGIKLTHLRQDVPNIAKSDSIVTAYKLPDGTYTKFTSQPANTFRFIVTATKEGNGSENATLALRITDSDDNRKSVDAKSNVTNIITSGMDVYVRPNGLTSNVFRMKNYNFGNESTLRGVFPPSVVKFHDFVFTGKVYTPYSLQAGQSVIFSSSRILSAKIGTNVLSAIPTPPSPFTTKNVFGSKNFLTDVNQTVIQISDLNNPGINPKIVVISKESAQALFYISSFSTSGSTTTFTGRLSGTLPASPAVIEINYDENEIVSTSNLFLITQSIPAGTEVTMEVVLSNVRTFDLYFSSNSGNGLSNVNNVYTPLFAGGPYNGFGNCFTTLTRPVGGDAVTNYLLNSNTVDQWRIDTNSSTVSIGSGIKQYTLIGSPNLTFEVLKTKQGHLYPTIDTLVYRSAAGRPITIGPGTFNSRIPIGNFHANVYNIPKIFNPYVRGNYTGSEFTVNLGKNATRVYAEYSNNVPQPDALQINNGNISNGVSTDITPSSSIKVRRNGAGTIIHKILIFDDNGLVVPQNSNGVVIYEPGLGGGRYTGPEVTGTTRGDWIQLTIPGDGSNVYKYDLVSTEMPRSWSLHGFRNSQWNLIDDVPNYYSSNTYSKFIDTNKTGPWSNLRLVVSNTYTGVANIQSINIYSRNLTTPYIHQFVPSTVVESPYVDHTYSYPVNTYLDTSTRTWTGNTNNTFTINFTRPTQIKRFECSNIVPYFGLIKEEFTSAFDYTDRTNLIRRAITSIEYTNKLTHSTSNSFVLHGYINIFSPSTTLSFTGVPSKTKIWIDGSSTAQIDGANGSNIQSTVGYKSFYMFSNGSTGGFQLSINKDKPTTSQEDFTGWFTPYPNPVSLRLGLRTNSGLHREYTFSGTSNLIPSDEYFDRANVTITNNTIRPRLSNITFYNDRGPINIPGYVGGYGNEWVQIQLPSGFIANSYSVRGTPNSNITLRAGTNESSLGVISRNNGSQHVQIPDSTNTFYRFEVTETSSSKLTLGNIRLYDKAGLEINPYMTSNTFNSQPKDLGECITGKYTISSSSGTPSTLFDSSLSNFTSGSHYTSGNYSSSGRGVTLPTRPVYGEWAQIEFPIPVVANVFSLGVTNTNRFANVIQFCASSDGFNWVTANSTTRTTPVANTFYNFNSLLVAPYRMYRMVVSNLVGSDTEFECGKLVIFDSTGRRLNPFYQVDNLDVNTFGGSRTSREQIRVEIPQPKTLKYIAMNGISSINVNSTETITNRGDGVFELSRSLNSSVYTININSVEYNTTSSNPSITQIQLLDERGKSIVPSLYDNTGTYDQQLVSTPLVYGTFKCSNVFAFDDNTETSWVSQGQSTVFYEFPRNVTVTKYTIVNPSLTSWTIFGQPITETLRTTNTYVVSPGQTLSNIGFRVNGTGTNIVGGLMFYDSVGRLNPTMRAESEYITRSNIFGGLHTTSNDTVTYNMPTSVTANSYTISSTPFPAAWNVYAGSTLIDQVSNYYANTFTGSFSIKNPTAGSTYSLVVTETQNDSNISIHNFQLYDSSGQFLIPQFTSNTVYSTTDYSSEMLGAYQVSASASTDTPPRNAFDPSSGTVYRGSIISGAVNGSPLVMYYANNAVDGCVDFRTFSSASRGIVPNTPCVWRGPWSASRPVAPPGSAVTSRLVDGILQIEYPGTGEFSLSPNVFSTSFRDWIQIRMPSFTVVTSYRVVGGGVSSLTFMGSFDGLTWVDIDTSGILNVVRTVNPSRYMFFRIQFDTVTSTPLIQSIDLYNNFGKINSFL